MAYSTEPILSPVGRICWPNLTQPDKNGKYGLTMIFEKGTDLKALKAMVGECIREEWNGRFKPEQLELPFKDGNKKVDDNGDVRPEYVDATLVTVGTKFALSTVLDPRKKAIPTAQLDAEVYPGCYCIAQVNAYAWEYKEGNKVMKRGVSLGLMNLMKVREGERLGGGKRYDAEDAFADVTAAADGSENPQNYDEYNL